MSPEITEQLKELKEVAADRISKQDSKISDLEDEIKAIQKRAQDGRLTTIKRDELVEQLSKDFEPFFSGKTASMQMDTKSTLFTGSGAAFSDVGNDPGIKGTPKTSNRIVDYLPIRIMGDGVIRYVQQTGYTDGATYTNEASAMTESSAAFAEVEVTPHKVASYFDTTEEFIQDVSGGLDYVTQNLTDTVLQQFDEYIWDGTTGANGFDGLKIASTDASGSVDASGSETYGLWSTPDSSGTINEFDVLHSVSTYLKNRHYSPDICLINPLTYLEMVNRRATDGKYVKSYERFREFTGLTPVISPNVDSGEYIVADSRHLSVYVRENAQFEMTKSDGSKFISDIVTSKVRLRGSLAVFQTGALIWGRFSASITALQGG